MIRSDVAKICDAFEAFADGIGTVDVRLGACRGFRGGAVLFVARSIDRSRALSSHYTHRPLLWRSWDSKLPLLSWILLNPSTATEIDPDPTLTRCCEWSRRWGFGGLVLANAYDWRSTYPAVMLAEPRRSSAVNDATLALVLATAAKIESPLEAGGVPVRVVGGWGSNVEADRERAIRRIAVTSGVAIHCLGTTRGRPRHPGRLAYVTPLERWPEVE